ncbi:MAG: hypothetical protein JSS57_24225 [Proteobacteria bacterium]|nr:hypothetical protein [Pseudomonadota bacterium]
MPRSPTPVFRGLGAAWLAIGLGGCIPAPLGSYYKPVAPQDSPRYAGDLCQGAAGAPVSMALELADGATLSIATRPATAAENSNSLMLQVEVTLRGETRMQWSDATVTVSADNDVPRRFTPDWNVSGSSPLPASGRVDWARLAPAPRLFQPGQPTPKDFSARLGASFTWLSVTPAQLEVALPGFRSASHNVGPRTFNLDAMQDGISTAPGSIRYRTAQLAREQTALAEACLREAHAPRHVSCAELASMKTETFAFPHGPLTVSGRWWIYDPARKDPLRGQLEFQLSDALDLEWSPSQITVRVSAGDATGEARQIELGSFIAYFRFRAPLTTELVGGNAVAPSGATRASFQLDLGNARSSHYRIALPPIRVGSTTLPARTIELERRRFDVGILPFNC